MDFGKNKMFAVLTVAALYAAPALAFDPFLLVGSRGSGTEVITKIIPDTAAPTTSVFNDGTNASFTAPWKGFAFPPGGNKIWGLSDNARLTQFNLDGTVVADKVALGTGADYARQLRTGPDGDIYGLVKASGQLNIRRFDPDTGAQIGTDLITGLPDGPQSFSFGPRGKFLYTFKRSADEVTRYNFSNGSLDAGFLIDLKDSPENRSGRTNDVIFGPDQNSDGIPDLFVIQDNAGSPRRGSVSIFDVLTESLIRGIDSDNNPTFYFHDGAFDQNGVLWMTVPGSKSVANITDLFNTRGPQSPPFIQGLPEFPVPILLVPEPATAALLAMGGIMVLRRRTM